MRGRIIKECYIKDLGVIIIDPNLHPYKKRHLIAHGLAHHLFHKNSQVNYFIKNGDDFVKTIKLRQQEREAEIFAAYLLIPEEKLDNILKEDWVKESLDPIPEMAEEFQVSESFMRKRIEIKLGKDK
jgi:Zn-dependent peptidase ImmA (M78 family)